MSPSEASRSSSGRSPPRFDFSPAVVSADDVEAWISWELGIDREQARCPSDLVAEVGAWITCTADSRDRISAEVELAVEVVWPPEPRPSQPSGADDSA